MSLIKTIIITSFVCLLPSMALSDDKKGLHGEYKASLVSVYDGDTFKADVYTWVNTTVRVSIRVRGIDTPEIRGKCQEEKELALKARDEAKAFLSSGEIVLSNVSLGKYAGRIVADVTVDGKKLSNHLLTNKYGQEYDGGKRQSWCDN